MSLRAEFVRPTNERRVLQIVHGLPETSAERQALLDALAARCFGGIVTNVSFKDYLRNEKYWADFSDGLQRARGLGMELWLYDEEGYPSGLAGGLTLSGNPEYQAEGVAYFHTEGTGSLELQLPEGELVYACWAPFVDGQPSLPAVPLEGTASSRLVTVQADKPAILMAFIRQPLYAGTHAEANVHKHQPYINIMDDRAVNKYIRLTHDAYEAHLRSQLGLGVGDVFKALFTDEPSLMTGFLVGGPQPAPVIPWCYDIAAQYQELWKQPLLPSLPLLFNGQGQAQAQARYRFWQLVANLVEERYFGALQHWAQVHGLASSGHQLLEESIVAHVYYYGDFMQSARRLDWPSIDQLSSRIKDDIPLHAKLLGSVAELNGAVRVMSESSDYVQQVHKEPQASDAEIKGMNGWLYLLGVNVITSYYQWGKPGFNWAEGSDQPKRDWCDLNTYLGRLGVMTQGARWLGEIGLLYPIEAAWAHFITQPTTYYQRREPEGARLVDDAYQQLGKTLELNRFDFTILDRQALVAANTNSGRLELGHLDIRCLVLPHMQYIALESMRRVHTLWENGGLVLAYGCAPEFAAETGAGDEVGALTRAMFASPGQVQTSARGGKAVLVQDPAKMLEFLKEWGLALVTTDPPEAPVAAAQRRLPDGKQSVMLLNFSAQEQTCTVTLPLAKAELWDPETGTITPVANSPLHGVQVTFKPQRALFFVETD
ncbi:MAG: glycosyl hydrolase family 2 protein [Anaerolineae bacterium]